jgi:hypothetical protein
MIIFDDDDLLSIMYICMYLYHCLETYLKPMHVLNQLLKFITGKRPKRNLSKKLHRECWFGNAQHKLLIQIQKSLEVCA